MIDPINITNYNLSDEQLEEYLLFCIAVAGKNAKTTSRNLDRFLRYLHQQIGVDEWKPFDVVREFNQLYLAEQMKVFGFGCYNLKSKGFSEAARSLINLNSCSPRDLEKIPGVGQKTSRFFILHTRKNAKVACLDTHLLRFLKESGMNVPLSTPQSKCVYEKIEHTFLKIAQKVNKTPADLDLFLWRIQSKNVHDKDSMNYFSFIKDQAVEVISSRND